MRHQMGSAIVAVLALVTFNGVAAAQASAVGSNTVDTVIRFEAADGTPLEAKLSIPADAKGPVPVVFHLHGAGPRNYDHALQYRDADGQIRVYRYYDFYAQELARRGLAFFRMSKRGCSLEPSGKPIVDRAVFSKATMTALLGDYAKGLDALRQRKEIDPGRIVLSGASEGTRLAGELAHRSPDGITALVLMGYAADNARDTVVWQTSVGPWRNIQMLIPAAQDGVLSKAEHEAAAKSDPSVATRLPFAVFDRNADGDITATEAQQVVKPRLDAILKAVDDRNDDFLWQALLNLSSAYLLDWWTAAPNHVTLLKLPIPIGIFHGELDGVTRVEGARETEAAFKAAGKTNLTVRLYPGHDHDLNWTVPASKDGGPQPFKDAFTFAADVVRGKPRLPLTADRYPVRYTRPHE